jgi:hypothetical protein
MDLGMSEIKPIDWDALPKVWAWIKNPDACRQGHYIKMVDPGIYSILEGESVGYYSFISETDPRIKTQKMRAMTAEELNDIYWDSCMKDFRFRYSPAGDIKMSPPREMVIELLSGSEYSTDRGKTWNKCEVEE